MKNAVAVVLVALLCSSSLALRANRAEACRAKTGTATRKPATAKPAPRSRRRAQSNQRPTPPSDVRFKSRYTTGDQITEG